MRSVECGVKVLEDIKIALMVLEDLQFVPGLPFFEVIPTPLRNACSTPMACDDTPAAGVFRCPAQWSRKLLQLERSCRCKFRPHGP